MTLLFERFISRGAQRAARHRRRLRARAARGGDPVHLREVRPRPRRARRDASSRYRPRARCATSARRSGLDLRRRSTRSRKSLQWWDGREHRRRAAARGRLRSRQPADRAAASTLARRADRLSAPPVAARRRLRDRARAARASWCRSRTPRWPTARVIQWDKDDLDALGLLKVDVLALGMLTRDPPRARAHRATLGRDRSRCSDIPAEDPAVYDMICRADTVGVFQIEIARADERCCRG